jgi:hypothetical protein
MCVCFHFIFSVYNPQQHVFELDSIAQQKATGTAKGDLRASQGGLYPPWGLMLSHILVRGDFFLDLALGWKNAKNGVKNPLNGTYPKSAGVT